MRSRIAIVGVGAVLSGCSLLVTDEDLTYLTETEASSSTTTTSSGTVASGGGGAGSSTGLSSGGNSTNAGGNSTNAGGNSTSAGGETSTSSASGGGGCDLYYYDGDGDGHGDPAMSKCGPDAGWVANGDDCNDAKKPIHPGAIENCNGVDDDCVGGIDQGNTCPPGCKGALNGARSYMFCGSAAEVGAGAASTACSVQAMTLARPNNTTENDYLRSLGGSGLVVCDVSNIVWIGASDTALEGTFKWVDGMTFWTAAKCVSGQYCEWGGGEPNSAGANAEDCVALQLLANGAWADRTCMTTACFACESAAP